MAMPAHLAAKFAAAKTNKYGDDFNRGSYILLVRQVVCDTITTKKTGARVNYFIPEFTVVESAKIDPTDTPNPVGAFVRQRENLDTSPSAEGNINKFFAALLGYTGADFGKYSGQPNTEDALRTRGMLVRMDTEDYEIKNGVNAGKNFLLKKYTHIPQTEEEIAARRREMPPVTVVPHDPSR